MSESLSVFPGGFVRIQDIHPGGFVRISICISRGICPNLYLYFPGDLSESLFVFPGGFVRISICISRGICPNLYLYFPGDLSESLFVFPWGFVRISICNFQVGRGDKPADTRPSCPDHGLPIIDSLCQHGARFKLNKTTIFSL